MIRFGAIRWIATRKWVTFRHTGQVWLPEIGLYYYKARMYSPTLGRFMQTDPIGYADGMNWYAYVGGDPVNFIDPTGTYVKCSDGTSQPGNCDGHGHVVESITAPMHDSDGGGGGGGLPPLGIVDGAVINTGSAFRGASGAGNSQPQKNPICPRNGITDALGKLQALAATAVGFLTGYVAGFAQELSGGPAVHIGIGNNAIQFTGLTGGSPVGLTIGNVQLYGAGTGPSSPRGRYDGGIARGNMGAHEEAHTYQWQSNSPASWAYEYAKHGFTSQNRFESQADDYADKGPRCP